MADNAVDTFEPPDLSSVKPTAPSFEAPDFSAESRQTAIQASTDPNETGAALKAADYLSPVIHPAITGEHPEMVSQEMYGKPMKASGLLEKIKGSVQGFFSRADLDALNAHQISTVIATGKEDPEAQKLIEEAKKKADPKQHLSTIPDAILKIPLGLGYDAFQAGALVAENMAASMTMGPISKMFRGAGQYSAEHLMGSFTGATYQGLRDEGIPPNIAAPFSIGGGLVMAALYGLKVEKIPGVGDLLEKAGADATAKAGISGRFSRTAKTLVTSGGVQGVLGALQAAAQDTVYELAAITNNLVNTNKVPLKTMQQIGEDMGISGLAGAAFGVIAGIPAAIIPGGRLDTRIRQEASKAEEAQKNAGAVVRPAPRATLEQNRAAYDARMSHLKGIRDSLQSKLSQVKDPEQRRLTQQRIDDLNKQLKTPFDVNAQFFAPKPEDETLGNLFSEEQAKQPEKPATPFELEQEKEQPTKAKPPETTQETFGFANKTPAEMADEAQQQRMFEQPQMEQSYEEWVAAGEKIASPTEEPGFTPRDPAEFNREFLKSLNDPHVMAQLAIDLKAHGQASKISTDLDRIAYAHRGEDNPVLSDSEMVRARSAVRRNIDSIKQYQAGLGDENMRRQLDHEATLEDPVETRLRKQLTTAKAKVKEQEALLENLRVQSDIERQRNTPEEQKKTGKEFAETATEAVRKQMAKQEEVVAAAHREEAIAESQVAKVPATPDPRAPVTESEFHDILFHDPGWERAQAHIADLKDQLHTAAIEQRVAVGTEKQVASNKVAQLREALASARKEAGIVVKLVGQDFKLKQQVKEAMVRARKIRDALFANVSRITKGAGDMPDEYRIPLEGLAGRINKSMGSDPRPIPELRDVGAVLGDHGMHPFSSWDKTDIEYLNELSKKPASEYTVNDLQIAHDALNDFAVEHQLEKMLKVKGEKIEKQYAAQVMNGEVSKRTPEQLKARVKRMNGRPEFVDSIWKLMKLVGKEEMHYSNLVAWLAGGEDSLTHKVLAGEVDKGNSSFRERVNRWGELHSEWFKKNGISEFDFFKEKRKVQVTEDGETRDLTRGYVMSAKMHSLREDNLASFKRGTSIESDRHFNIVKMSDGLIQKMFDEMTLQENEYVDHLTAVIAQVSKELDDAHYQRYERHPQLLDNYWHIARITETMTRIQDRKFQGIDVGNPDIFRHRTGAVTPIYWRPAENELFNLFNRAGRWIDLAEPVGHARGMLAEISLELQKQQGDDKATTMIAKGLAAYAGKRSTPEEFESALLKMRSAGTQSVLGGPRVTTMMKNVALGIRSIPYVGFGDWSSAAFDVLAHPKIYHHLWTARSGLYEDISRAGGSKELQDLFLSTSKHPKLRKVLLAFEMAGMRAGSRIELESAHRGGLRQIQSGELSDLMRRSVEMHLGKEVTPPDIKSWTPEERDVLATSYAEALLKRNHMTTSPGFQANLTREGTFGILATTLQSEKIAGVNMVVSAWMDAPTTKNGYKTAVKASIVHFIAEPAIMAAIRVGWAAALGGGAYALLRKKGNQPAETVKERLKRYGAMAEEEVFADWASNLISGGDIYFVTKQAISMAKRGAGGGGLTLIGQYPQDFLNVAAGIAALAKAKSNQKKFNAALSLGIDSMTLIGMATGLPIKGVADVGVGVFERAKEIAGGGQ